MTFCLQHNNFEMSQMTIKLQLDMLWKLIELTDPIFAQYLGEFCLTYDRNWN